MIIQSIMLINALMLAEQASGTALPDPTRPFAYDTTINIEQSFVPDQKIQWKLQGIKINPDKKQAVLNGQLVKEGDVVGDAIVLEINPADIVLMQDSKRVIIKLMVTNIKRSLHNTSQE